MMMTSRLPWPIGFCLLFGSIGCSSADLNGPVSTDPAQLYWTMKLSAHAITMSTTAPNDTLQLTATPLNAAGAPLTDAPAPTFTTSDSSVRVSPTGLLTARAVSNDVLVIATLTYRGIRLADTAVINVTATVPATFRQLQLQLQPGDSARIAARRTLSVFYFPPSKTLLAAALDSAGGMIPNSLVALRTSDELQGTVDPITGTGTANVILSFVVANHLGPMTVYASATVYGVTLQDSLQLTITTPLWADFSVDRHAVPGSQATVVTMSPSYVIIGVGGVVDWDMSRMTDLDSLDIVFDDPTAASDAPPSFFAPSTGGGDIPPFPGSDGQSASRRARQFLRAGTFQFHSTRIGATGTIIVQDQ